MKIKRIAIVAHDNCKKQIAEWVEDHAETLYGHEIVCTGSTGKMVKEIMDKNRTGTDDFSITMLKSGPLGGDQQLGAMIADEKINFIVFFWDPMEPQPHDVDVKALLRISVLYNVPTACNRATADLLITSKMLNEKN